jgi:NAD(P)-dependent dehydrogenase (short-subunit alcohol dehydrogenase family)
VNGNDRTGRGGVVVTGASSGIGRACALHLDALGFQVFAGVRKDADAEGLRAEGSERLEPLVIDVTDRAAIEAASGRVRERVGEAGLAGLVNNAGIAVSAPLEFIPIDELRRQLEVNVIGQVAATQAFLDLLRKRRGRIVNIGSVGGRIALPFVGAYAASKFALEAITDSLRRELRPWGISVSIVEPGAISTSIWEKGTSTADAILEQLPPKAHQLYGGAMDTVRNVAQETARRGIPPENVAKTVAHALTAPRPRTRYVVGRDARTRIAVARVVSDRTFDRLVARTMGL